MEAVTGFDLLQDWYLETVGVNLSSNPNVWETLRGGRFRFPYSPYKSV